jgi:hypothetical protein
MDRSLGNGILHRLGVFSASRLAIRPTLFPWQPRVSSNLHQCSIHGVVTVYDPY